MLFTRRSPISGAVRTMDLPVSEEQLEAWHSGTYIQNAMPHLSADQREFIMTGIYGQEWFDTFYRGNE